MSKDRISLPVHLRHGKDGTFLDIAPQDLAAAFDQLRRDRPDVIQLMAVELETAYVAATLSEEEKRTAKGFTVRQTRVALDRIDQAITGASARKVAMVDAESRATEELVLASLIGVRNDLIAQLKEVGVEP